MGKRRIVLIGMAFVLIFASAAALAEPAPVRAGRGGLGSFRSHHSRSQCDFTPCGDWRTPGGSDQREWGWEARLPTPGNYQLTFECHGFKKLIREGVTVTTSETPTVNVQLEVGTSPDRRGNGQHGDDFLLFGHYGSYPRQEGIGMIPTSSRNFTQLLMIESGVSADISELTDNSNSSISPSVNGARTTNNSFVYNGVGYHQPALLQQPNTSWGAIDSEAARFPAIWPLHRKPWKR